MALLVFEPGRFLTFSRVSFFLPMTMSTALVAVMWNLLFDPNLGLVNSILAQTQLGRQGFFFDDHRRQQRQSRYWGRLFRQAIRSGQVYGSGGLKRHILRTAFSRFCPASCHPSIMLHAAPIKPLFGRRFAAAYAKEDRVKCGDNNQGQDRCKA